MHAERLKNLAKSPLMILLALLALAILGFLGVSALVRRYDARQRTLAVRLFHRGQEEEKRGQIEVAITTFRASLGLDRENYLYELSLAKALVQAQRYPEAHTYLASLWERMPESADVNVELARLAVHNDDATNAVRYYHNAIYGIWSSNPDVRRRQARLELVNFLIRKNDLNQARAELIASASSVSSDLGLRLRIADLFMQIGDYGDAYDEYRAVLRLDRKNVPAMIGAAKAAFQLHQYRSAERLLQSADAEGSLPPDATQLLKTVHLIVTNDPYGRGISEAERHRRILDAFQQADDRLQSCAAQLGEALSTDETTTTPLDRLHGEWLKLRPNLRRQRGDIGDDAMDLVFRIEQQTKTQCGAPQGFDLALLLIGSDRQGAER